MFKKSDKNINQYIIQPFNEKQENDLYEKYKLSIQFTLIMEVVFAFFGFIFITFMTYIISRIDINSFNEFINKFIEAQK